MVERGLAHLADHVVLELARDVDAVELGAQGAGDRPDLDMAVVAHPYSFAHGGGVLAMKCRMPSDACGRRSRPTRLSAASSSTARSSSVAQASTRRLTVASGLRLQLQDVVEHGLHGPVDLGRVGAEMAADAQAMGFRRVDHAAGDREVARRALADAPHHERDDLRGDEARPWAPACRSARCRAGSPRRSSRPCRSRRPPPSPRRWRSWPAAGCSAPAARRRTGGRPAPADRRRRWPALAACRPWRRDRRRRRNARRRRAAPARGSSGRRARGRTRLPAPASWRG